MVDDTFAALAEPNRLRILQLLRQRPHSVGELSELLKIRQPQVSKHLQVLNKAGLVHGLVFAQKRIYSLLPQPLIELEAWLDDFLDTPYAKSLDRKPRRKK
jgi:DNA-binding transcriptional ArsR family regulator